MRLSIRRKLFYSHFLAVVLVSGSVGTLFYQSAVGSLMQGLRSRLQYSAALLSQALDARDLGGLRSAADTNQEVYRRTLALLRDFQASNPDIAFIYVMRRDGQAVSFVLDSDPSPAQALPGKLYEEATPQLWQGFAAPSADEEISRDEWGYFLSGYAPLRNGRGELLVGIDMRADDVHRKFQQVRAAGLASLLASVILALLASRWIAARITRPIRALVTRAGEIAEGHLSGRVAIAASDELGELATAFDKMSDRLQESHAGMARALAALDASRLELEDRVRERTAQLEEVNRLLVDEVDDRRRAQEALALAASTDFLTGLVNRPALLQILEREAARFERHGRPFCLLLADLDHFKEINDRRGHDAGDAVLVRVARIFREAVRAQDTVARWGGDELLVFLPETPLAGGLEVAEKIRRRFATEAASAADPDLPLTLSLGVCAIAPGTSIGDCIRAADAALYRAKEQGRDRVEAATRGPEV